MEPVGAFSDEEFDFLKMFTNVDADFLLSDPADNLSQNFDLSPQAFIHEAINTNMMDHDFSLQSFDNQNVNSYVSQESSNSSSGSEIQGYFPYVSYEDNQDNSNFNNFVTTNDTSNPESMDFLDMDNQNGTSFVSTLFDNVGDTTSSGSQDQLKRKLDVANETSLAEVPKKKPRVSRNENKRKNGGQTKKNKNKKESSENAGKEIQTPISSSISEDGSNASQEPNGDEVITSEFNNDPSVPNSKGKTRAARGNATDPQSLYARKRRERINERLRILQTLVPNGTKVDISTMLEEAVQYVKFLQIQIQLLSSDDMWMFAPLAFNGIDVGVYQRMFPNL